VGRGVAICRSTPFHRHELDADGIRFGGDRKGPHARAREGRKARRKTIRSVASVSALVLRCCRAVRPFSSTLVRGGGPHDRWNKAQVVVRV